MAGWQVVAALESDAQACQTHAANFPEVKLHEKPERFSIRPGPMKQSLASIPSPLR
ncbi:hypothetical protein [Xanthobacter sp. KR7-225]|uniref:hypothetical protein n=1 Tax=Xanthobacter sp. KR7-225 TaxID=3156613 RepID=UPI0032B4ECEA